MKKLKIGVALSGGAMCGVAHIGFLRALEENNIKVDMISGISMGSIIGGLYASGMSLDEIEKTAKNLSKSEILELNFFKILKEGIFSGKRIEKTLKKYLKVENIEDAKIKFYTQATDVKTGKLYTFENGPFVDALRASSAIPGIFSPVLKNDTCYIDGGVIENIPFRVLKEKGADVIIAVNCLNDFCCKETPKNTFSLIVNTFNVVLDNTWKRDKEIYKDSYDIFCTDAIEGIDPFCTDLKKIPKIIEEGRKKGELYIKEIKEIIKNKKKLLQNT